MVEPGRRAFRARHALMLCAVPSAACSSLAPAQEFTFYTGGMTDVDTEEESYSWRMECLQGLGEHVPFTWSWVNEGHVLGHHRDGQTLQFWIRENVPERKLSLALGAGYQLQAPLGPGARAAAGSDRAQRGRLVRGTDDRQQPQQREERRGQGRLPPRPDTLPRMVHPAVNEGDPDVIRRNGITSQVWAARTFLRDELEIGLGVGLYDAVGGKCNPGPDDTGSGTLAGVITPSFGWRFAPRWSLRLDGDRTVTSYDRDTDSFGLGVGYGF